MAKINITIEGYKCERCNHEWIARLKGNPIICPRCKSPYWNKPKRTAKLRINNRQVAGRGVQVAGRGVQVAGRPEQTEIQTNDNELIINN